MYKYILLFLLLPCYALSPIGECGGKYRWDYKICIDPEGIALLNTTAEPTTINALTKHTNRPIADEMYMQRATAEKRKVTLTAYVIMCGKEDDEDFHLVLKSTTGKDTLIAEIPDPACPKVKGYPYLVNKYSKARQFVLANIDDSPGGIKPVDKIVKVKVTGIVFFDKIAHGSGHAPNGVEIHPILDIKPVEIN